MARARRPTEDEVRRALLELGRRLFGPGRRQDHAAPLLQALALTDQQKREVYKVRATYAAKIAKLNEEIAALRLKEKADTEAVLTDAQKASLKELRSK